MSVVVVCHGFANGAPCPYEGQYLEWYDPERPADEVMGGWTPDLAKAKRYDDPVDALRDWRRVREFDGGRRADGEPDRPLTAFTVEVRRLEDIQ